MSIVSSEEATAELPTAGADHPGPVRGRRRRKLVAAGAAIAAAAGGALIAVGPPFGGSSHRNSGVVNNAYPTSLATVTRRSLSSDTQVGATLGYAGSYSVVNQAQGTLTRLPAAGQVVDQGHVLYKVSGQPVVLLYGSTPTYRSLSEGMSGADVAELNADLVSLGDATRSQLDPSSDYFSSATAAALEKLQAKLGVTQTGTLKLGQAVFLPTAARIASVMATLGAPARPGGPVLQATSTKREVIVDLDPAQQSEVKVGDRVTITLPDNQTTPGVVSSVGTVATTPSSHSSGSGSSSGGSSSIEVDVTPIHPAATGNLDQAPVEVSITTGSVNNALVVPVDALLAQAGGGYAVEVAGASGTRHLVPVSLGLFDDADNLVQVNGSGLAAGQQVVVPQL